MRPMTFDDAREQMAWEPVEQALLTMTRALKEERRQLKIATHNQWKQHWRTRLARMLRSWASKIELPEPE